MSPFSNDFPLPWGSRNRRQERSRKVIGTRVFWTRLKNSPESGKTGDPRFGYKNTENLVDFQSNFVSRAPSKFQKRYALLGMANRLFGKKIRTFFVDFFFDIFSKFRNFHFFNWLFEEKFSNFFRSQKNIFSRSKKNRKKSSKSQLTKWKFRNFEKVSKIFRRKKFGKIFRKIFSTRKFNIFWRNFLSSKSWLVLSKYQFSASNSTYKIMKTQQLKKLDRN